MVVSQLITGDDAVARGKCRRGNQFPKCRDPSLSRGGILGVIQAMIGSDYAVERTNADACPRIPNAVIPSHDGIRRPTFYAIAISAIDIRATPAIEAVITQNPVGFSDVGRRHTESDSTAKLPPRNDIVGIDSASGRGKDRTPHHDVAADVVHTGGRLDVDSLALVGTGSRLIEVAIRDAPISSAIRIDRDVIGLHPREGTPPDRPVATVEEQNMSIGAGIRKSRETHVQSQILDRKAGQSYRGHHLSSGRIGSGGRFQDRRILARALPAAAVHGQAHGRIDAVGARGKEQRLAVRSGRYIGGIDGSRTVGRPAGIGAVIQHIQHAVQAPDINRAGAAPQKRL